MQRISDWIDSIPTFARLKRNSSKRTRPQQRSCDSKSKKPKTSTASCSKLASVISGRSKGRNGGLEYVCEQARVSMSSWSYSTFASNSADDMAYLQHMRETWQHACTIQSTSSKRTEEANSELERRCVSSIESSRQGLTLPLNRPLIRTNPWISPGSKTDLNDESLLRNKTGKTKECPLLGNQSYKSLEGSRRRARNMVDRKDENGMLDESMSSSGYGSQDSSPESSVINPDWDTSKLASEQLDKDSKNFMTKFTDRCSKLPFFEDSQEDIERIEETDELLELDCNGNTVKSPPKYIFRRHKTSGAGRPPSFHAPPPPPNPPKPKPKKSINCGTLAQLDANMDGLRAKSTQLQEVFVRTKEARKKHLQEKQLCLEHVQWIKEQLKFLRPAPNFEILL